MNRSLPLILSVSLLSTTANAVAAGDMPSREEMWKIIQQQQKQIETLMSKQKSSDEKIEETVSMVEATADAVDQKQTASVSKTHIGGYGELHYKKESYFEK